MEGKNAILYGYSDEELEKITGEYCKNDHCHTVNCPISPKKSYWESLKEGCDALQAETDIVELI